MIAKLSKYIEDTLSSYIKIVNILIYTIFFNLFLYLKDISIIFKLSNIDFTIKEIAIFFIFVFSFISIIFIFLLLLLVFIVFIKNKLKVKSNIVVYGLVLPINILFVFYIILDLKIFKLLGVHIHDKIAMKAFTSGGIKDDISLNIGLVISELISPTLIVLAGVSFFIISSFIIKKIKLQELSKQVTNLIIYPLFFSIFFSIYLWVKMNSLASLVPIWSFIETGSMINKIESTYDNNIKNIKLTNKKNIIIVIAESFRKDVFNSENMPNMFKFIDDNKSDIVMPKHSFSGSHFTLYSIFSLWYSVWGYNYRVFTSFTKYKESAGIKLFNKLGYDSLFLTASHILEYDEAFKQVTKQFSVYKEFNYDKDMIKYFKNYYKKNLNTSKKPFITFLFIYASHYDYRYPKNFKKYLPVLEKDDKNLVNSTFKVNKKYKKELFNRYKNSVLYVDSLFNDIISTLNDYDKKNTIIVFTGDHGEGFWEHGTFGHALRSYKKEIIEVPLLLFLPNLNKNIKIKLSSHVDILPTILNYITSITEKQIQKFFNGVSLLKETKNRTVIISSLEPIGASDGKLCLLNNKGKIIFKTTKLSNNAKFIPLEFLNYQDKSLKNKKIKKSLLKNLDKFEKSYFKYFYFHKK